MAGTNPAFSGTAFRTAIRSAMNMGLPGATADRATFRWTTTKTYTHQDDEGVPFDLGAPVVTQVSHADVQIPVAWTFQARPSETVQNPMGEFDNGRVVLTILDLDYALVEGADQVLLGENIYDIEFVQPPIGLFEVTVYQVWAVARDES